MHKASILTSWHFWLQFCRIAYTPALGGNIDPFNMPFYLALVWSHTYTHFSLYSMASIDYGVTYRGTGAWHFPT